MIVKGRSLGKDEAESLKFFELGIGRAWKVARLAYQITSAAILYPGKYIGPKFLRAERPLNHPGTFVTVLVAGLRLPRYRVSTHQLGGPCFKADMSSNISSVLVHNIQQH